MSTMRTATSSRGPTRSRNSEIELPYVCRATTRRPPFGTSPTMAACTAAIPDAVSSHASAPSSSAIAAAVSRTVGLPSRP